VSLEKMEISNIEPFSQIRYISCFYSALFPVVKHFKGTFLPYLISDIYVYANKNKDAPEILLSPMQIRDKTELTREMGIFTEAKEVSDNIVEDSINAISNNRPVIVMIDSFYEPLRQDVYQKEHIAHALLLFGYDKNEKTFTIFEHSHKDSFFYERSIINFVDLKKCYEGYINNLKKEDVVSTYCEYYADETAVDEKKYINFFVEKANEHKSFIFDSLNSIKIFTKDLIAFCDERERLASLSDSQIRMFNRVMSAKIVETYALSCAFGERINIVLQRSDEIINNWNFARGVITKFKYSSVYNEKSFRNAFSKLEQIYDMEYENQKFLFKNIYV